MDRCRLVQVEGRGHKPGSEMTIRYHERADDLTKTLECGFKKGYAACKEIDVIHVVKNKKRLWQASRERATTPY